MDQLTLHIGHQKTGTTSLQFTFRDNAALLAEHGLHFWDGHPAHHPMARKFHAPLTTQGDHRVVRNFVEALKATSLPQAMISTETFVRLTDDEVKALVALLRPLAKTLKVLVYVRHPVGFASSAAHQRVRMGGRLAQAEENPGIVPLRMILKRWTDAVGPENMIVRPFDRGLLKNGDVIDDALDVLGVGAVAPKLVRVKTNEALSVMGIYLMDRALAIGGEKLPTAVGRAFDAIGGPKYVLPEASLEIARKAGAPELAFLEREFGVVLPEPTVTPTDPPHLSEDELESLAGVILQSAQYAFDLTKSPAGRLLEMKSPFALYDVKPHPLTPWITRLGLMPYFRGETGARKKARTGAAPGKKKPGAGPKPAGKGKPGGKAKQGAK
ncbi:hypothetical protein RDV64_12920 [Acuticoccus sp. MNP-M23]|uniref:hypothetical protein n=1 Tax=Acuticoccus sp. MNP-M23 TaxID=3072793 RepID=UPI0028167A62|nr:hypothetical protein [Acuticoccus sp. MNP-M23]WMS40990.1 hypothetical protein RDV64_12920 [Acuticoccus sp. MNP-M23]